MADPQPQVIEDRIADDAPGAREIGFSVASRYNSSAILFDNLQRGNGSRIALRGPAGEVSYDALCGLAGRAGNALLSLGLTRGERVLLLLDDTPLYPAFLFGAIRAGLVPVPPRQPSRSPAILPRGCGRARHRDRGRYRRTIVARGGARHEA